MKKIMMRKVILIFLLIAISHPASAQWRKIDDLFGYFWPDSAREFVHYVNFLDLPGPPRIGYVGTVSEVWRTIDGGDSWAVVFSDSNGVSITDICFKDSITGWFTGFSPSLLQGVAYRTTNGGKDWQKLSLHANFEGLYWNQLFGRLLFATYDSGIRVSTDLGLSWFSVPSYPAQEFSFSSDTMGIVASYIDSAHDAMRTTDGGLTWTSVEIPSYFHKGLAIAGTSTFFEADYDRIIVRRSDDYGRTWKQIADLGPTADSLGYEIAPAGTGRIAGDLNRLYIQTLDSGMFVSTDQGLTWQSDGGPSDWKGEVFYAGKGVTIAGSTSDNQAVLAQGLWKEDWPEAGVAEPPCIDSSLSAISVSENPLHEGTTLRFELTDAEYVRVEVFDVLGNAARMVAPLEPYGLYPAGEHTMPVSLTGLPIGTYFLRITLDSGEIRTLKLVKE